MTEALVYMHEATQYHVAMAPTTRSLGPSRLFSRQSQLFIDSNAGVALLLCCVHLERFHVCSPWTVGFAEDQRPLAIFLDVSFCVEPAKQLFMSFSKGSLVPADAITNMPPCRHVNLRGIASHTVAWPPRRQVGLPAMSHSVFSEKRGTRNVASADQNVLLLR